VLFNIWVFLRNEPFGASVKGYSYFPLKKSGKGTKVSLKLKA